MSSFCPTAPSSKWNRTSAAKLERRMRSLNAVRSSERVQ
jgi:hypothetical protein